MVYTYEHEPIKSESSFDNWEREQAEMIALKNGYWAEAVNDLLNEELETEI